MSIIVSVKINDGIVLASDSATTFYYADGRPGQIYEHVNKIVNLVKGFPVGVMTCGAGGIGNASIATLLKDLRQRLVGADETHSDWKLDHANYSINSIAYRVFEFIKEKSNVSASNMTLLIRVCGYTNKCPLPEVWDVILNQGKAEMPVCRQPEDGIGPMWAGENEALNRLITGLGAIPADVVQSLGLTSEQVDGVINKLVPQLCETLILPAAPIQDAIDLARFMVETTKSFVRFSVTRVKTVGGPIEIATITKHEGFKWIQRKHFYSLDLNPI